MVGEELALASQSHGVNAVRLEDADSHNGADAHNHERHEEIISVGDFGYKEDARERGVHHSCHHSCHAKQREVLLGDVDAHLIDVPKTCEEESAERSHEE